MSNDDFIPQKSYRDLHFGMSPAEVETLLGPETRSTNLWEEFDHDPEDMEFVIGRVSKVYDGYPPYHEIMELTFQDDRLVEIHIQDSKKPILFRGINLFSGDRQAVIDALFEMDQDLYGRREHGFFSKLGIVASWASKKKSSSIFYMQFVDSEDVLNRLDFDMLDPLDAPLK